MIRRVIIFSCVGTFTSRNHNALLRPLPLKFPNFSGKLLVDSFRFEWQCIHIHSFAGTFLVEEYEGWRISPLGKEIGQLFLRNLERRGGAKGCMFVALYRLLEKGGC
jgi:hypothetical protein